MGRRRGEAVGRDYVAIAAAYESDVLSGVRPACKWVRLACERNRRDRDRSGFAFGFDAEEAARVCGAVELLPHIKGEYAKPQYIEGKVVYPKLRLEPWQCWILCTMFGWRAIKADGSFGLRRFRTALIMVPRKNGKSVLSAAVMLFMLTADGEAGAECYSAATTRDQAKIVAEIGWEMSKRSPDFCAQFGVTVGAKTTRKIEVPATASKAEPLSADAHTLDGLNVSFACVDELHAHKTRGVWDVIETATGARDQPVIWAISTAGVETGGICYEQLSYLHKLLEGTLEDETYFGINYTVDEDDDWRDPAVWEKANPNFGVSVKPDDLARKAAKAAQSPASINNFLTKHLNVWVRAESTWMPMDKWHACGDPGLKIEDFADCQCWIGVDLAEIRDMAAVVALFKTDDGYAAFGRYFLPAETVQNSPVAQLSGWVKTDALIETDGDVADYRRIEDTIYDWCQQFNVREICYDRAFASQMAQTLEARIGDNPRQVKVQQGVEQMDPMMQTVLKLVLEGKFKHDANPVLAWMAGNVVCLLNHKGEMYPRKAGGKDSPNKIDGIMAIFTALFQARSYEETEPQLFFLGGGRSA